ncbi:unnamed protein product, partial [Mycena citricolor]
RNQSATEGRDSRRGPARYLRTLSKQVTVFGRTPVEPSHAPCLARGGLRGSISKSIRSSKPFASLISRLSEGCIIVGDRLLSVYHWRPH